MCQLTFINLHDRFLNKISVLNFSMINSMEIHRDGFGFFTPPNTLIKTKNAPSLCTNLGLFIEEIGKNPVISHVRKASGKSEISKEKAHPFSTERLVLAHNGSLELKPSSSYKKENFSSLIDTEIFLKVLDEIYLKNKNLVASLKEAYSNFTGKFAFLIYEFENNDFYVVRGETAPLHKVTITKDGKRIGFIVNTEKESMTKSLLFLMNQLQLRNIRLDWPEKIEELSQNTVYKLDKETDELIVVDEIKEEKSVVVIQIPEKNFWWKEEKNKETSQEENETIFKLFKMCDKYEISLSYLDELLFHTIGRGVLGCEEDDIKLFLEEIFPYLISHSNSGAIKAWRSLGYKFFREFTTHRTLKLEFPFFFNDPKIIKRG